MSLSKYLINGSLTAAYPMKRGVVKVRVSQKQAFQMSPAGWVEDEMGCYHPEGEKCFACDPNWRGTSGSQGQMAGNRFQPPPPPSFNMSVSSGPSSVVISTSNEPHISYFEPYSPMTPSGIHVEDQSEVAHNNQGYGEGSDCSDASSVWDFESWDISSSESDSHSQVEAWVKENSSRLTLSSSDDEDIGCSNCNGPITDIAEDSVEDNGQSGNGGSDLDLPSYSAATKRVASHDSEDDGRLKRKPSASPPYSRDSPDYSQERDGSVEEQAEEGDEVDNEPDYCHRYILQLENELDMKKQEIIQHEQIVHTMLATISDLKATIIDEKRKSESVRVSLINEVQFLKQTVVDENRKFCFAEERFARSMDHQQNVQNELHLLRITHYNLQSNHKEYAKNSVARDNLLRAELKQCQHDNKILQQTILHIRAE